jgi:hypothetical protein
MESSGTLRKAYRQGHSLTYFGRQTIHTSRQLSRRMCIDYCKMIPLIQEIHSNRHIFILQYSHKDVELIYFNPPLSFSNAQAIVNRLGRRSRQ